MHVKKYIVDTFYLIYLFFSIYAPRLFKINSYLLIGIIAWLLGLFFYNNIKTYINLLELTKIYMCLLILVIYAFLNILLHRTSFNTALYLPVYFAISIVPSCICICVYFAKRNWGEDQFWEMLFIVGNIQGIISLSAFCIPDIQYYIIHCYENMGMNFTEYYANNTFSYRFYGLSGTIITYMPLVQSFLSLMAIYYAIKIRLSYWKYFPLLAFSALINARSTIIILGYGIVLLIFTVNLLSKRIMINLSIFNCVFIILVGFFFLTVKNKSNIMSIWIQEGIEDTLALLRGEKQGIYSILLTEKMIQFPPDVSILLGTGVSIALPNKYLFQSDVGYINYLWYGGIVYLGLIHFYVFAVYAKLRKCIQVKYIANLLLGIIVIFNFKMPVIDLNEFIYLTFLVYAYYVMILKKHKNDNM